MPRGGGDVRGGNAEDDGDRQGGNGGDQQVGRPRKDRREGRRRNPREDAGRCCPPRTARHLAPAAPRRFPGGPIRGHGPAREAPAARSPATAAGGQGRGAPVRACFMVLSVSRMVP
ncbi:hypothetical protein GCM10023081_15480 [Arthrobacter ginkgonis]|uniref:Uncharacterized protein n=1 Tax=Arthrobacter ginkgonis TaxID=1630594 RepID=A0ABP7C2W6_9MICC